MPYVVGTLFALFGILVTYYFDPVYFGIELLEGNLQNRIDLLYYSTGLALNFGGIFLIAEARLERKIEGVSAEVHEIREMVDALAQKIDEIGDKLDDITQSETPK